MRFLKKFIPIIFSVLFLLSMSSAVLADPGESDDPVPPLPILPGDR